ncbi:hypothetical protein GCM10007049_20980 [Echinicola pacifica]|uniref:Uncharacterized protein n=2 Tax=Echinicola pacifica TaxID=346377 RepID=A0A918Q1W8_9BACT|nr:hypothetical protein GCM10007049_20980 [Echinicola pacifica]
MFSSTFCFAQMSEEQEIQLIQSQFGMEKRELIEKYMNLSETEAPAFWVVYQNYESERQAIAKERIMLASRYVENYDQLGDDEMDGLAKKTIANNLKRSKLHAKYYTKFKKATSATQAAKFLQVDDYIHSTLRLSMQEEMPFIGEME